jgi:hypothetical protein
MIVPSLQEIPSRNDSGDELLRKSSSQKEAPVEEIFLAEKMPSLHKLEYICT